MLPGNLNVSRTFVRARAASSDGDEEGDLRTALQQSRRRGRRAGVPHGLLVTPEAGWLFHAGMLARPCFP